MENKMKLKLPPNMNNPNNYDLPEIIIPKIHIKKTIIDKNGEIKEIEHDININKE